MKKALLFAQITSVVLAIALCTTAILYCFWFFFYTKPSDFTGMLLSLSLSAVYVALLFLFKRSGTAILLFLFLSLCSALTAVSLWIVQFNTNVNVTWVIIFAFIVYAPLYGLTYFFQSANGILQLKPYLVFYTILIILLLVLKLFLVFRECRRRRRNAKNTPRPASDSA